MDHAVAIVEAYLQINGYFTVAEYPVIESLGKQHYNVATDIDILAFRFPGAGRLVPGRGKNDIFEPDPVLGIDGKQADMIIGEVKEGRTELNRPIRNPNVLRTVLARFGCCPIGHADKTVQALIRKGECSTHSGHHVRLMGFGSSMTKVQHGKYCTISLGHITKFIEAHLREHWKMLRHAQFKHPALGLFMVIEKARIEADKRE